MRRIRACMITALACMTLAACGFGPPSADGETEQVERREYTPEQRAAAREVMREARRIATFEDERTSVAVTFDDFIFRADSQERYRLIRSIADADAVLSGRTRIIRFFRTDGKRIGQADPSRGVRLID